MIKVFEGNVYWKNVIEFVKVIGGDDRIIVIDEVWFINKVYGLMVELDVYLLFYCVEGFGFIVVEV